MHFSRRCSVASWEESIQPVSVGGKAYETKGSQILEGKTRNNILGEY